MLKLLLIDDNPTFLQATTELFAAHGKNVTSDTATSAEAGLLFMSGTCYDVIVSDYRMPGLDGLTLLQESTRLHPSTPVILVTGYADCHLDLEEQAMTLGAYAFLHKPVDPDLFLTTVNRAVLRSRSEKLQWPGKPVQSEQILGRIRGMNERLQKTLQLEESDNPR